MAKTLSVNEGWALERNFGADRNQVLIRLGTTAALRQGVVFGAPHECAGSGMLRRRLRQFPQSCAKSLRGRMGRGRRARTQEFVQIAMSGSGSSHWIGGEHDAFGVVVRATGEHCNQQLTCGWLVLCYIEQL